MPFTDIAPYAAAPVGTGLSMSVSEKGVVRLTLNERAQNDIFKGSVVDKAFFAKVGRGADEGRMLLVQQEDGDLVAKGSMRGSASLRMQRWDLLPNGKSIAAAVEFVRFQDGGVLLQLPRWAKPSGVGGKIAQEHALKRTPKRDGPAA